MLHLAKVMSIGGSQMSRHVSEHTPDELAAHRYSSPRKARCWREANNVSNSTTDA